MAETPKCVLNLGKILEECSNITGIVVGTNDLAKELVLPSQEARVGLSYALGSIVLRAKAYNVITLDGVFNSISDQEGLLAEAREGKNLGYDGKTLIHPNQIDTTNTVFAPTEKEIEMASKIIEAYEKAKEENVELCLPVDVVCADHFSNSANTKVCEINNIPDGWQGMDAGPKSLEIFNKAIMSSKTILWNGPVGVFEMESFSNGTVSVGKSVSQSTNNGSFSLVGGGDSVAAVKKFKFENKVSYVSTGGGAMLESLEGKTLPGIKALE